NLSDQQITTLRVSSSIATTGGKVGIGRYIYDSFALVYPHESLGDRRVIVGDSLQGGSYSARSGALGPAVANHLSSYLNQTVRYDVANLPPGYNIGSSVKTVHPAYRSGYAIEVGHAAFVSAMGVLIGANDRPAALVTGAIRPVDDPSAEPELFFTSTSGRFAIQNLEPGRRYRVELASSPRLVFEFDVPRESEGLLELGRVVVPLDVP
ncbi:MAG TPA: fimbrial biogenesis outer membrane usher protein, partial [Terricaulis sp.]|nr:fimbrial biogenesis outer membrane usher protein [Terricaulis sp.]